MFVDLAHEIKECLEALETLNESFIEEIGSLIPVGIILSLSDGNPDVYGEVPQGQVARAIMPLPNYMGGCPETMLRELMHGIRDAQLDKNAELAERVDGAIEAMLDGCPEGPEEGARIALTMLLEKFPEYTLKDIPVMLMKRMVRELEGMCVILSLDSMVKVFDQGTNVDLNSVDLSTETEGVQEALIRHVLMPNYQRIVTTPYTRSPEGDFIWGDTEESNSGGNVVSRYASIFGSPVLSS